ncbi:autotransporter assembly complex family protein [Aliiglaciecola sp. LCG003]|uniref:autotransporter assembly complex protein TamA n=1 Tax=Aliiglaciecola sp. LCG003 TaxID=3053655 RepID=UPI002573CD6F|nr:autotransporter assembly complex family protein [Aliiglaciecola sp. LCG003]WJG09088.1 autotransporter assembly complex family protein [Aliiglaciecola sp. LCG003]
MRLDLLRVAISLLLLVPFAVFGLNATLHGVKNGELENNIQAHLSALETPKQCSLSNDAQDTIESKIALAAKALGYYQIKVDSITFSDSKDCDKLIIHVEEGPRVKISELNVKITGDGKSDRKFEELLASFPLKAEQPLIHSAYKTGKSRFDSMALNRGYFDSKFVTSEIVVNVLNNSAIINLEYDTGPRYRFGELIMPDNSRAAELITSVLPFKVGEVYLASKLGEFNQNLGQTGYFQQIVARPLLQKSTNHQIPIEIIAVSRPRDIFNVGVGASTNLGPKLTLNWQRPWVNNAGHSVGADISVSAPEQDVSFKYKIPLEDPLNNYFSIQTGFKAKDNNDSNFETFTVATQRHWSDSEALDWNKTAFLRYELTHFQQAELPRETTGLLIPGFTLSRHRTRGGLDVNWGDQQMLTIEVARESLLSDIDLARITFQTKWLRSLGEHRFLFRAEVGALTSSNFDQVTPNLRYFAGGDQSVRGFDYESLAPREIDENGVEGELLGAKYLNVASLEYSYPVADKWRAAVFTDVGGASNKPLEKLAYSVGVGGSWMSPVGPIRIYLARGFGDYGTANRIHFAMGPVL